MTERCTSIEIGRLVPSEVARFLGFRAEGLRADPDTFRVSAENDAQHGIDYWRQRLGHDHVVAAVEDGRWVGLGGFSRFVGRKLEHKGLIWGMYVAPDSRGTGVGDLIIEDLLEYSRTCVRQVQLTVMADNERAIAFYRRPGFEWYATEPAAIFRGGSYADEMLMWRAS